MSLGQIVARPPNAWLLRVHQGIHLDTGKQRYWNRTVHGDRAVAEAELARMLAKVPVKPSRASSLSEYLNCGSIPPSIAAYGLRPREIIGRFSTATSVPHSALRRSGSCGRSTCR